MQLMMFIGNDLIEAVPINVKDLQLPGYLGKFKRHLKLKYSQLLQLTGEPAEFLVSEPELHPHEKIKKG